MSTAEIKLEVCVDSISSAVAAMEGGASRIELCSALSEGGLTPQIGTLNVLKDLLNIPIYCMLRPRRGNDFNYSAEELKSIIFDLELLRAHGADGFVFGALTAERLIDAETCQRVVQKAAGLPVTFHRAFDLTNPNLMHDTLEQIKELGFTRLLSSGFRQSAAEGCEYLAQMIAKHHRNIIVMPGAGINVANLEEILTVTKCIEFHTSAKKTIESGSGALNMDCDVSMGKQDFNPYEITDSNVVRKLMIIARAMASK